MFQPPGFELSDWLASKNLANTSELDYLTRLQLQDDLGITSYLSYPSCELADRSSYTDGWINGKITELIIIHNTLPNDLAKMNALIDNVLTLYHTNHTITTFNDPG